MSISIRMLAAALLVGMSLAFVSGAEPPKMKFNEVREVAPGVFFRYASISATDPTVPFGGCNNIWIVFQDFVVVIDANFPREARLVLKEIRKTTDKPVRYVLDTHHHGDHAYGNAIWAEAGATIVGQVNCFRLLRTVGPEQFRNAGAGATGRKDVAESYLKTPSLVFDDKLVIDDGNQRVEFLHFGHCHTRGDAVAYLPKHKILCTGDACVNGAFNFMGHSNSASWIQCLDRMAQLDIDLICPGHGPVTGKDLLQTQKRYFVDLRQQVQKGIDAGKDLDAITASINMPWYKEWTGKDAKENVDNIKHVYDELTGKIDHSVLGLKMVLPEGDSYCRTTPGWAPPRTIVTPNLSPRRLAELRTIAPRIHFIPARTTAEAVRLARQADAVLGFFDRRMLKLSQLRWIQLAASHPTADPAKSPITLTQVRFAQAQGWRQSMAWEQEWLVWKENVRRFSRGDRLLGVVR